MIEIIDEYILVKTLEKVQRLVFLVLGDEVSDISNEDQLTLVLRFVNEFNQVREELSDFVQCSCETNGEALSNILSTLTSNGLDLQLMEGRDIIIIIHGFRVQKIKDRINKMTLCDTTVEMH